jgi:hypothetical protein
LILVFMLILCALPHFVPAFVRDGIFFALGCPIFSKHLAGPRIPLVVLE